MFVLVVVDRLELSETEHSFPEIASIVLSESFKKRCNKSSRARGVEPIERATQRIPQSATRCTLYGDVTSRSEKKK